MAQYKAAGLNNGNPNGFMHDHGNAWTADDTTTPSAALALNDTIDLLLVPGGVRLQRLFKFSGDFDTGTTLQYKLGYRKVNPSGVIADVDNYFGSTLTDLQAAVTGAAVTNYVFAPIQFAEDVFITLTVTAAATGVSGTPAITMFGHGQTVGIK